MDAMDAIQGTDHSKSTAEDEEDKPEFQVSVSSSRLLATLTVQHMPQGGHLTEESVLAAMKEKGVVFGICSDEIRAYCSGGSYGEPLICAKGLEPQDEQKAEMKYFFRMSQSGVPLEREDGTVDYHDLGLVQNVKKGSLLCRIIPSEGKEGMDVYGKPVPYRKYRLPAFPSGSNTVVSEDRLELSAGCDGCIEYHKNILNINQTFVVHGNVDNSSGNINFIGTVVVQGDVLDGFSITAGGDISVHGMVGGAKLKAGGNITISDGVNAMSGGSIAAGGNIQSRYIQNAMISCGGSLFADVLMNSRVTAVDSIVMRGQKSSIIGGRCCAGKKIYAKTIGTDNYLRTDLDINSPELDARLAGNDAAAAKIDETQSKLDEAKKNFAAVQNQLETVRKAMLGGNKAPQIVLLAKALIQREQAAKSEAEKLEENLEDLQNAPKASLGDFYVVAIRQLFTGTRITIGGCCMSITSDYSNTKFYMKDREIVSGPVLPSDVQDF